MFSANADQAVVTAHEEPAVVIGQAHEIYEHSFGGIYIGFGIGGSFLKNKAEGMRSQSVNRFIGAMALGGGKVFNEVFYFGLEGMMDFTKSKKQQIYSTETNPLINGDNKNGGFVFSIGTRFGYINNTWNTLFYGKITASHTLCEVINRDNSYDKVSLSKFTPAFGLGIEKFFCKRVSMRLESDYRLPSKKRGKQNINRVRRFHQGFTCRALVAYNISI